MLSSGRQNEERRQAPSPLGICPCVYQAAGPFVTTRCTMAGTPTAALHLALPRLGVVRRRVVVEPLSGRAIREHRGAPGGPPRCSVRISLAEGEVVVVPAEMSRDRTL